MNKITSLFFLVALSFLFACNSDECIKIEPLLTLDELVAQNTIARDSVIACASGSINANEVIVYAYPRPEAEELRYFETDSIGVDENDFQNYTQVALEQEDVFRGYLNKFTKEVEEEKWVIVTFLEKGILNLSTPIRLKHQTQNTIFTDELTIDQSQSGMPHFDWESIVDPLDVIYFQVVSDSNEDLLSGTYTFDPTFRYYNLDNVVLNITRDTPPDLLVGETYGFTLMGVSEDNWVNTFIQTDFLVTP